MNREIEVDANPIPFWVKRAQFLREYAKVSRLCKRIKEKSCGQNQGKSRETLTTAGYLMLVHSNTRRFLS